MSDTQSIQFDIDQSLHINPLTITPSLKVKINNKVFQTSNPNTDPNNLHPNINTKSQLLQNKCVNVLTSTKLTNKLSINPQFQQYLAENNSNQDAVVVSFLGKRKIGKSFLVDSLLTAESNKICRLMCKSMESIINSPIINQRTNINENKLVYFDCNGECTNQIFLWNYFLASVIVYNMGSNGSNDVNQNQKLFNNLAFVQSHLDFQDDNLSLPQFILIIRDAESQSAGQSRKSYRDLVNNIEGYNLFQSGITVIHMPYPGSTNVTTKQIVDVPLKQISSQFLTQVQKLKKILKNGKPKTIKNTYLSTKLLSLTLEPLTKYINKQHKIDTNKIWDQIIENLSIGFYNYYLQKYDEQLLKQFQNERPVDKYTMYKKLSNMKHKINKKIQTFTNLKDNPIFIKYKQKLKYIIKSKQKLIKQVNQNKSKEINDRYSRELLADVGADNCSEKLMQFCRSDLDDLKFQSLVDCVGRVLEERARSVKKMPGKTDNLHQQIQKIEYQIQKIEKKIRQSQNTQKLSNIQQLQTKLEQKTQKIKKLQKQIEQNKQNIKNLMNQHKKSNQIIALQQQCEELKNKIDKDQNSTIILRQSRQREIRQLSKGLQAKLKQQQQILYNLQQRLKQARKKPKKVQAQKQPKKNDGCCCALF